MKKIKHIRFLFIVVLVATSISCEESLEPVTFNMLSPSNFPKSEEDVTTLITGVYNDALWVFRSHYWQYPLIMNEATCDVFYSRFRNAVWFLYSDLAYNSGSEHVTRMYSHFVKAISNCVNTIEIIKGIDNINQELKVRFQSELHGIIAICAFYLYDFYGPTAIVTDPDITLNAKTKFLPTRPTKEWMVNFIKEEARLAVNGLPKSYDDVDYGRITKGTALTVLLKLAMHEKNWNEAIDVSTEIMDLDYYQLQSTYWDVFTVENEMNNELVFVIPCHVNFEPNGWMGTNVPSQYRTDQGENLAMGGYYRVFWSIYDLFEEGNDDRLKNLWRYMNTVDGVVDLRTSTNPILNVGAVAHKYPRDPNGISRINGNDFVVFRYSDLLLLRAEALNNLYGLNQESVDLINMIRERAKTTLIELSQFSSTQSLNDYILDERARELFMEGHRRPDLIRHGKYLEKAIERGVNPAALDEHLLIFPIPQAVIDENPNIIQNAGY